MSKSIITTGALAMATSVSAQVSFAADESIPKGQFYLGGNIGWAWANSHWATDAFTGAGAAPAENVDQKPSGATGGGQIGYWRFDGHWMVGAEGSLEASTIKESGPSNLSNAPNRVRETRIKNPYALTGQLGYTTGNSWRIYGRGGRAFSRVELQANNLNPGGFYAAWYGRATGWIAGAGVEYTLGQKLGLGIEYDYSRMTMQDLSSPNSIGVTHLATNFKMSLNQMLARLSYRF